MDSAAKMIFSLQDKRVIVMFLFLNDHNAAGIHRRLGKTLGTQASIESHVRRLLRKFWTDDFDVKTTVEVIPLRLLYKEKKSL